MHLFRTLALFALASCGLGLASTASAYPNYISYGYQSCLSCHYNPHGNGPLTDYGRALSATEISDRMFWGDEASEEDIAEASGFLREAPTQSWFRPSLNYRGLGLYVKPSEGDADSDYIMMDVSASVVLKFLKRDKLTFVGQIGYAPKPRSLGDDADVKTYRSREHYIGYRLNREMGVYAGLMDKVFGIRTDDHTAFIRTFPGLTQNDQTHGIVFHYSNKHFELGLHPFVGNLVQDEDKRQKGFSTMAEVSLGNFTRLGASALSSKSDFREMNAYSLHGRFGLGEGHSLLSEVGQTTSTMTVARVGEVEVVSQYAFVQGHLKLRRGLWFLTKLEAAKPSTEADSKLYRIAPAIQYFPVQRVELRTDFVYSMFKPGDATLSSIMSQLHLWL